MTKRGQEVCRDLGDIIHVSSSFQCQSLRTCFMSHLKVARAEVSLNLIFQSPLRVMYAALSCRSGLRSACKYLLSRANKLEYCFLEMASSNSSIWGKG